MGRAAELDGAFGALASATRRAVVERLRAGPASVSELAAPFEMALPSFLEHVRVLEAAGLVRTWKRGRVRTVRLVPGRLRQASAWLEAQRQVWEKRLDQLDSYLDSMGDDAGAPGDTRGGG